VLHSKSLIVLYDQPRAKNIRLECAGSNPYRTFSDNCSSNPKLTTSFLSIARRLKDNRLLPKGWDPNPKLAEREGLGSVKMPIPELIAEMQPVLPAANGQPELDPNFGGGGDTLTYRIPLASLPSKPASVKATLEFIPIKSWASRGSGAPGNCAGHSRAPSRDRGRPPSTGGSDLSQCDNA
jgi:hypothetical protein